MQNKENTTEKYEKELNRERERESERGKGHEQHREIFS